MQHKRTHLASLAGKRLLSASSQRANNEPKDDRKKTSMPLYLPREVKRQLEQAAEAAHVSQSVYVMQVLQAHFKRRGIE
jgi:predicted HicB family RNase H-like nuclease